MRQRMDLTGQQFGRLTVLHEINPGTLRRKWACVCSCGNTTESMQSNLREGKSTSCGCIARENIKQTCTTHGKANTPLYRIWCDMTKRLINTNRKDYHRYGGRGITRCVEWEEFEPFYQWAIAHGYAKGLTLDREDNEGNYKPSNCRFVSRQIQATNQSKRKNTTSKYIGVSAVKTKWLAGVTVNKQQIRLGLFDTEILAAKARDQYIINNGNPNEYTLNF